MLARDCYSVSLEEISFSIWIRVLRILITFVTLGGFDSSPLAVRVRLRGSGRIVIEHKWRSDTSEATADEALIARSLSELSKEDFDKEFGLGELN